MLRRIRLMRASRQQTFEEVGTTGLRHYGGYVVEEWLAQLSGQRGAWAFREMADNDPIVGAFLFAIEMLARGVTWEVEPGDSDEDALFVEQCMDDMSHTWADFIAEVFTMLVYGWDWHEIVYKRRLGPEPKGTDAEGNPLPTSRYDDGRIGWRKLPTRAQETLEHWEFADDGGLNAMVQVAYDGIRRTVPLEKSLLFRTTTRRGNPEGRSALRTGYTSYFALKNLRPIELIGIERDVAGLPTLTPPEGVDLEAAGNEQLKAAAQDLVTGIRKDEDAGVVLPSAGWKLELLKAAGASQTDPDKTIRRYEQRLATTVLADFILLAQDAVGSFALGQVKVDTFGSAMQAWLEAIAQVLNRYAVVRLLRLNGRKVNDPPKIVPGDVGQIDADKLATFLQSLSLAGAPLPWSFELIKALFEAAGLPEPDEQIFNEANARGDDPAGNAYDDLAPEADVVPDATAAQPPDGTEPGAEARGRALAPDRLAGLQGHGRRTSYTTARSCASGCCASATRPSG
jgi:hypothetical protein